MLQSAQNSLGGRTGFPFVCHQGFHSFLCHWNRTRKQDCLRNGWDVVRVSKCPDQTQILMYKARVFSTSCLTRPETQGGQHGVDRNWEHSVSVHMQHQSLPARDRWRQWAGTGPRLTHEGYMAQSIGPHNVMNTGDCQRASLCRRGLSCLICGFGEFLIRNYTEIAHQDKNFTTSHLHFLTGLANTKGRRPKEVLSRGRDTHDRAAESIESPLFPCCVYLAN